MMESLLMINQKTKSSNSCTLAKTFLGKSIKTLMKMNCTYIHTIAK